MPKTLRDLTVPKEEIRFTAARSGGPGGQKVNKVSSQVTLWFDVRRSSSLSEEEKRRLTSRLSNRINKAGVLRITVRRSRSQTQNRRLAEQRFRELLAQALEKPKKRKKTQIPSFAREVRLAQKKKRGRLKAERSPSGWD